VFYPENRSWNKTSTAKGAEAKNNNEIVGDGNGHDFKHNLSVFLPCASAPSCSILFFQTASDCGFQINKFLGRYRGMIFQLIYAESNKVVRFVPVRGRF
jgi:hypothetical protein